MEIKDESIGVVPVFNGAAGENLFLVVLHKAGHWAFPKGHQDAGESELDTAKRELYEETGIKDVELKNQKEFLEFYSFERHGKTYYKRVKYFIGLVLNKETKTPDKFKHEIKQTKWLSYTDALEILTFKEARDLLHEVKRYLESK